MMPERDPYAEPTVKINIRIDGNINELSYDTRWGRIFGLKKVYDNKDVIPGNTILELSKFVMKNNDEKEKMPISDNDLLF